MKHLFRCRRVLQLGSVITCLLMVAGCTGGEPVAKKQGEPRTLSVKTVAVETTAVKRTTRQPATVHAYYRAEVRAKASGFVIAINADIGDYVEKGAELASIDVPELLKQRDVVEAKIKRLESEERRATAGINLAKARVRSAEAMLSESKSQLGGVEASLAASEAEFDRTQDLVQRGSLQNRMLDEARMKRDSELARRDATASSVESAQAQVEVAQAQVESAIADFDAAQADTQIARRQLEELDVMIQYATVTAPFGGVVTERNIEPGDLVRQASEVGSGKPLFVVSQVDKVRIRIPVPESDAPLVNRGDEVTLTFPSFASESPIVTSVTRRSGSLDPSTRTMLVEAEVSNADGKLLPGMFGQASINLNTKVAANMLPAQAIRFDETGNAYVYAVSDDETVSVVSIQTGIDDGNSIEVLSGVEPGQRVIGPHLKRFVDGEKVAVLRGGN
ncbi:efflux RND transporter periplasmic adaptor subunit [Aporhodopirellula aestuarii]|uniref:Efflux RND transporter periplasmic adaptor subunit n=1 Tax=Aporhodopirellula aestuarii TaxID=2950107 RepID=A0ABT0U800_9BACT|nr:efflux RND transporter periplasmic adaptor subunit [Aporhodopirellula aestuarii]MCM2372670.1 efflux RND transporter periplasmic adaptor subunit [Aporhodopirellula aestuarii]